ncbi:hypothetical protein BKA70DRAFT_1426132 [Coprinopsis sp. MPI-PUGE-AT-0042]|nr:hypothetical protein BKA70DRAFT_1426132 [Coprinopsis sp. MPI-PUGE-AT-0042]
MVVVNKRQVEPGTAAGIDDTAITVDPNAAADATNLAVDGQAPTFTQEAPAPRWKPGAGEGRNSKTWDRLDSGEFEDKWDGKEGASATAPSTRKLPDHLTVPPLEKMDMFKKSPSTSSHHGASSDDQHGSAFEMQHHPYSQVNASTPKVPEARDLLGREPHNALGQIDSGPPISWASSPSQTSFLSAARIESGAMSPTFGMAIPTPPATRSQPHRWESAEVVNLPEERACTIRFFSGGGSDHYPAKRARSTSQTAPRSRSNSQSTARSRSNSNATITQQPALSTPAMPVPDIVMPQYTDDNRLSMDPFNDPLPVPPTFARHQATGSASSAASNERAIRQLVAAAGIDLNEDEVQRRLKAVSMQPSVISNSGDSMYTDADPDLAEEALKSFPQPPGSTSSHGASSRF